MLLAQGLQYWNTCLSSLKDKVERPTFKQPRTLQGRSSTGHRFMLKLWHPQLSPEREDCFGGGALESDSLAL